MKRFINDEYTADAHSSSLNGCDSIAVLAVLHPGEIGNYETRIRPFLDDACEETNGRFTADIIIDLARKGLWQIWTVTKAGQLVFVGGTEIRIFHTGLKVLEIRFGVGKDRQAWQHHLDSVLNWAKAAGCLRATGAFRIGWRRVLPGWLHTHEFLERAL
jgi:hypothetical protein